MVTMRAVVVVNWRAMARLPAQNQHLGKLVATDAVARVVAGLEANVRAKFVLRESRTFEQGVKLFERREALSRLEPFGQLSEGERTRRDCGFRGGF